MQKIYINKASQKEINLYKNAAKGQKDAALRLFNIYKDYAIYVAKKFSYNSSDVDDYKQIALLSLYNACFQYDYTKSSFKTYIYNKIHSAIYKDYMSNNCCLNISAHVWAHKNRTNCLTSQEFDSYITENNISEKIKQGLVNCNSGFVSLNSTAKDDSDTELCETVKSQSAINPADACIVSWKTNLINSIVNNLEEPKKNLIKDLYGLDNCQTKNSAKIAREKGVSRQSVNEQKHKLLISLKREIVNNHPDLMVA